MKLRDLLGIIQTTAQEKKLSTPYIVGGCVRDRVRGEAKEVNDIDLTTAEGDSVSLAFSCADKLDYSRFDVYDDGHIAMNVAGLKIDFSNHFIIPNIDKELDRLGVKDKSPLAKEMFSRDFTINTLLQDLSFTKIYDITGKGAADIKAGIIRCPINPELTIKNDPKRILRALRFALRFGYIIEEDLVRAIKKYAPLLKTLSPDYVKDKTNELLTIDKEKAIKYMYQFGLLKVIPLSKSITEALIDAKLLYYAFE